MEHAEFDKFADDYRAIHDGNISISGENSEYFAEYKVLDCLQIHKELCGNIDRFSILDFGAGVGSAVPFVRRYAPDADLTCIDISSKSLGIAQTRFGDQAKFIRFDGREIPFPDDSFDLAFAACVLHHIDHRKHLAMMSEFFRVVKPGGLAVIYEHNPYNPVTRYVVGSCPFDENARLISARTMRRRLTAVGFPRVIARYRVFFPSALRFLRPLERFLDWLPIGAQYYVAAQK